MAVDQFWAVLVAVVVLWQHDTSSLFWLWNIFHTIFYNFDAYSLDFVHILLFQPNQNKTDCCQYILVNKKRSNIIVSYNLDKLALTLLLEVIESVNVFCSVGQAQITIRGGYHGDIKWHTSTIECLGCMSLLIYVFPVAQNTLCFGWLWGLTSFRTELLELECRP